VNVYENYAEMLSTEQDLHAAIIATPDWMHAEQTKACLEAGLHVYCEKGMATNLADAKFHGRDVAQDAEVVADRPSAPQQPALPARH
jgi:myo-inositol 2-dehydrogenase/D-chiro-inositol 1-dehydrogenase